MIKIFCDACGCQDAKNKFSYRVHLDSHSVINGYVDNEGNFISGRDVDIDLCNRCYNEIVGSAVKLFKDKQEENKKEK